MEDTYTQLVKARSDLEPYLTNMEYIDLYSGAARDSMLNKMDSLRDKFFKLYNQATQEERESLEELFANSHLYYQSGKNSTSIH